MFTSGDDKQLLPTLQLQYETRAKHNNAVPVKELKVRAWPTFTSGDEKQVLSNATAAMAPRFSFLLLT